MTTTSGEGAQSFASRPTAGDLVTQHAWLEAIFDLIPQPVRVCDPTGRFVRENRSAQETGLSAATIGEVWERSRPERPDGTPIALEDTPSMRALAGETVIAERLRVYLGERRLVVEFSARPLRDAEGRVVAAVSVARDVTEEARLAQELAEQVRIGGRLLERVTTEAERLERMVDERTRQLVALQESRAREQRLAAVGQLAAGVMHDVNNALNPIMAAAYLLARHADDPDAVREYAARIAKAAETGTARTGRLARFIRQEPSAETATETVDLAEVCAEAVTITQPLWRERTGGSTVSLDFQCPRGAVVRGDAAELRAAVINLVHNALDAMPGGGTLSLATCVTRTEALLEVRDTGAGMPPEVAERAFEPFFTTKGPRGSGLGLAEVYGIVRRHRGRADLTSVPGTGTVARLVLPLAPEGAGLHPDTGAEPRRVLLVSADRDAREFMISVLRAAGHVVDASESAEDAVARLDGAAIEHYDALLLDADPASGAPAALAAAARARHPGCQVILVSGGGDGTSPVVDRVVRKPLRAAELLSLVTRSR